MHRDKLPGNHFFSTWNTTWCILPFASSAEEIMEHHSATLMSICNHLHVNKPANLFKIANLTSFNLNIPLIKVDMKLYPGIWDTSQTITIHKQRFQLERAAHNFSHVNSVTALPCKVQFIYWLVFLPFPWNSGKSILFVLFFSFLKSSSYKVSEQTTTSSTKKTQMLRAVTTNLQICLFVLTDHSVSSGPGRIHYRGAQAMK